MTTDRSGALDEFAATYLTKNASTEPDAAPANAANKGSARRKLWDLAPGAHCPVSGVCLRLDDVKRLAGRAGLLDLPRTEYDLHVLLVAECKSRTPLAEQVQRSLDQRYDLCIRKAREFKTEEALAQWWDESVERSDWAGVFWAVLTHPRCSTELEYLVLGQVHMLQHQSGMATRVDHTQLACFSAEYQRLGLAIDAGRRRMSLMAQAHARKTEEQQAELMVLRAELIRSKTAQGETLAELENLRRSMPSLATRERLAKDKAQLQENNSALRSALLQAEQALKNAAHLHPRNDPAPIGQTSAEPQPVPCLSVMDRSVLCVGGRKRVVPIYREVVEERGARFSHHDGGNEDKVGQLGHMLQAADLVVCQVGCVSHDAYWRVKEHCKRHNKPCLFVETPSRSAIERALEGMAPATASLPVT